MRNTLFRILFSFSLLFIIGLNAQVTHAQSVPSWTQCANEDGQCSFTGTRSVLFGVTTTSLYSTSTRTNGVLCSYTLLGDPAPGRDKKCWYDSANLIGATTTATTTPTNNTLTILKSGTGTGTVTSSPSGINCGSTCSTTFASGTAVTLTATPTSGHTFSGWSGSCTGTGTCSISMNIARSVTATFATSTPVNNTLTVTKSGTGSGAVTSSPAGITCGTTCSTTYASGTAVTLTATADSGSTFSGWSGACSGTGTCSVAMSLARSVTATFATTTVVATTSTKFSVNQRVYVNSGPLNVRTTANGTLLGTQATNALGTVIGGPVSSSSLWWWNVNYDTGVDGWSAEDYLTATTTPAPTATSTTATTSVWVFCANEDGQCSFTGTRRVLFGVSTSSLYSISTRTNGVACTYSLLGDPAPGRNKSCWYENIVTATTTATTTPTNNTLTILKSGTGTGTVTSSPSGINCGSTCSTTFASGTAVTLTATPTSGHTFSGWSGSCTGTGTCSISMNIARSVTATFATATVVVATSTKFTINQRVYVNSGPLNVRQTANGILLGQQATGALGSVIGGPTSSSSLWWWNVNFDSGVDGWAAEDYLTATTTQVPATTTPSYALSVVKSGTGAGTVSSSPTGISCGTTCGASFTSGTLVTLTAVANSGSTFTGWSGLCTGTGACTVTVDAVKSVTATFTLTTTTSTSTSFGTPRSSANIFISGHSLLDNPLADDLLLVANSLGTPAQYNEQIELGSPIRYRTRGDNFNATTSWIGYTYGKNKGGTTGMNVINELLNPQTIGAGNKYNVLLITERHDLLGPLWWEATIPFLRHYHERALAGNAQSTTYFYEPWLDMNKDDPTPWINYERQASTVWRCEVSRVNTSLAGEGRTDRLKSLPAGRAVAFLIERATTGNVPGITLGTTRTTVDSLVNDTVHLTELGVYYMSLVTYSSIYQRSPVGATYPSTVTATQAASLQSLAWEFVSNYYANETSLDMAGCQAYMRDTFCQTYYTFRGGTAADIASCKSDYTTQSNSNPLYYNASTDSSVWYPAP